MIDNIRRFRAILANIATRIYAPIAKAAQRASSRWLPKRREPFQPELGPLSYSQTRRDAERLAKNGAFSVFAPQGHPKWLLFRCPCGCGEIVNLNLMKSASPRWEIRSSKSGFYSVSPSVDSQTCGSHYWIREGRIHWC